MAATRNQPAFDFLTGGDPAPQQPAREPFKQSTTVRADINNESLRAQINTLQYELDSIKQERELAVLQHQSDIRDAEKRAEADFRRAQTAETERNAATKKYEALSRETKAAADRAINAQTELERKIRTLQEQNQSLREEYEDGQTQLSSQERQHTRAYNELESRHSALQGSVEDVQRDLEAKVAALQTAQQRLTTRDADVGDLENEILRLKAQTGDLDTLAVIKRELSEQVAHIKRLEGTNREHLAELKQFRRAHKSVEVVEEEKRVLQSRLRMMEDLRKELAEAQLQRQILEDEKASWTSYLESTSAGKEGLQYDSPEDMAKAFVTERLEKLSLVERLGAVQPELSVKDNAIRALEDAKAHLKAELEKTKATGLGASAPADGKIRARLERQKNLAIKEVEYLRAQIKTFEAEETEFEPGKVDEVQNKRVQELEGLIGQYRTEVQTLQMDLDKVESAPAPPSTHKRALDDDSDERLGELRRKIRSLQDESSQLQTRNTALEAELKANVSQLTALRESSRTRVLELRNNPTANAEAIKQSTLTTLREENRALLSQLQGDTSGTKVVPISTLESVRQQMRDLEAQIAQRDLKQKRLKDIWNSKFLEFTEAVAATLGWKVVFMPNGRFKVASILYPSLINTDGEEEENSILFDGEQGTMKVSGGPQSLFANEIRPLIEFWVDGRKEIPCFLAACSLEFYDRSTRAAAM